MTGIVFPNVANALMPLMQMDRQAENDRLQRERLDKHDQWMQEDRQQAREQHQLEYMSKLDERQRAHLKEQFEVTGKTAAGILSLPEADQPAAYEAAHAALTQQGYKINLPGKWSPSLRPQLQSYAIQVPKYLEMLGTGSTALPSLDGAPAPSGPVQGGGGGISPTAFMQGRIKRGDDPVTAAAWAGNVEHESSFNPTAFNPKDPNGGSHGLIQWNGPRAQALRQFAATRGGNPADPEVQQDFLQSEIDADPQFKAQLAAAPTVQDKAALISMKFIRPAGGQPEALSRGQTAVKYTMGTPPPELVAQGANAAQMPNVSPQQLGAGPGTPVNMPEPRFAQAGGPMPPGVEQGGGEGSNVIPPPAAAPHFDARTKLNEMIPGARLHVDKKTGMPLTNSQGLTQITYPNGQVGFVAIPVPEKPQQPPSGYRPTPGGLEPIPGGPADREKVPQGYRMVPGGNLEPIPGGPGAAANTKQNAEQANKLRDDFRQEPDVKRYRVVVPMLESAKDAVNRPTRAADINLVYAFAKLMDPESVVRESEVGMVTATGTVADKLEGLLSQLNGGQMLTPETRAKLVTELESRFKSTEASYNEIANAYGEIADANGIKRSHVVLPIRKPKSDEAKPESSGAQGPQLSPEEAAKLPPGTPFVGKDGVPRVKN